MARRDQSYRDQLSLFDLPSQTVVAVSARKITRASHPETSVEAAEKVIASGKRKNFCCIAFRLVSIWPGKTGYELDAMAQTIFGTKKGQIRRRLGDLRNAKLLRHGEKRACTNKGSVCKTWYRTERECEDMTASSIPVDTDGLPIENGKRYVLESKGIKPVKVEVSYDDSVGSLCARQVSDMNVVVWKEEDNESNALITWRRVLK